MKKLMVVLLMCLMLASCTSRTELGECIGIGDEETPTLKYKPSVGNIIVGAIFFETIIVPLVVLFTQIKCPVERR